MNKIALLLLLFFAIQISIGQESYEPKKHPKVGLVLSGGGAKGLAHIGVLKIIDSLDIQIDYIAGTSMGAIIGGLYASGYSGKELDSIFSNIDVDALLQDYTPRASKTFYEKRNDELYALSLPFNNFKIGLPSGLSKGLYNFNLLTKLTKHVSNIRNFEHLPIPFLCIATDVETGEKVVLENGILAQAMMASGALPTLYNPIQIDKKVLIDGGVVDNYPVEELKNKGISYVIGVDVQDDLKSRELLNEVTGVLTQINNFSMIHQMEGKKCATSIYIKPNINGFSVVDFNSGKKIISKGTEKAKEFIPELKVLKKTINRNKIQIIPQDSIHIDQIVLEKQKNYTHSYIIGKLKFKKNTKISFLKFQNGILNLNATQNFGGISYGFEKTDKGENLILNLHENKVKTYLKFGLHYDDLFKSGVLLNYTKKRFLTRNDVLSVDFILGDNIRYNFDYYIDNGFHWSFGLHSKLTTFNKNISTDFDAGKLFSDLGINAINIDFLDVSNQIYMQTIFAQKAAIGAGLEYKYLGIESKTVGSFKPIFDNSSYLSAYAFFKIDTFDKKYFTKNGLYFNSDLQTFLYSSDYTNSFQRFSIFRADFGSAKTINKNITIKLNAEAGFAIGDKSIPYFDFILGGYGFQTINNIKPFFGYDFLSISGDSYVKYTAILDYEVYKKHHLNITANFANLGNRIFEGTKQWLKKPEYSGFALGYGMETIIGPLEIKHSWSPETKDHHTWFSVGFWF